MRQSQIEFGGLEVRAFDGMVAVLANQGIDDGFTKFIESVRYVVGQIAILGATPHGFYRIEIGRVGREPLDRQPTSALLLQKSRRFAMNIEAIQHDDQLSANLPMQMPQKGDDIGGHDIAGVELPVGIDPPPLGTCEELSERFGLHVFETEFTGKKLHELLAPTRG